MPPSPTSLTPPRFVNLAARAVYGDLPAPLFQSYARLAGLTWNQTDKAALPPLTLGELSIVLGCRERQTWEHLHALRRAGWLEWTQSDSRLCIRLTQPPLQSFANPGEGDDDDQREKPILRPIAHARGRVVRPGGLAHRFARALVVAFLR